MDQRPKKFFAEKTTDAVVLAVLSSAPHFPALSCYPHLGMLKFNKCFPPTVFLVASFSRFFTYVAIAVLVVQFFDALLRLEGRDLEKEGKTVWRLKYAVGKSSLGLLLLCPQNLANSCGTFRLSVSPALPKAFCLTCRVNGIVYIVNRTHRLGGQINK